MSYRRPKFNFVEFEEKNRLATKFEGRREKSIMLLKSCKEKENT